MNYHSHLPVVGATVSDPAISNPEAQAIAAEVQVGPALRHALDGAFELFAEFSALWLKHVSFPLSDGRLHREVPDRPGVPVLYGHARQGHAP